MHNDSRFTDEVLDQRLIELEMRLAFQEQAMNELNQALTESRLEGARNSELLRILLADLGKLRSGLGDTHDVHDEPPPPHY